MNVLLERDGQYVIQLDSTVSFKDGSIDGSKGFTSSDLTSLYDRVKFTLAVPLRREWLRPWFRVVARFGGSGGEETLPRATSPTVTGSTKGSARQGTASFSFRQ